jgi:hypothetical protein
MAATAAPTQVMQGIEVPASSLDPQAFFRLTRRLTITQKTFVYAGLGLTDNVPILQTGIVSGLNIKFSGSLVTTAATGAVATTARWPYDLIRAARFSANAQSNLINVSGQKLKARDIMARGDLCDRGVVQAIGGAFPGTARTQGTLALNNEAWGVGSNVSAITPGTYPVELDWYVPVAFDNLNLLGAIFAQTSSTDLNLALDWAPATDLFVLTGTATAVLTGTVVVAAVIYSIPLGPHGEVVVPDLSAFHSLIQVRTATVSNGLNEIRLAGQGVGRQLLRVFWQFYSGAVPAPLPINAVNVGQIGWRFGGNDTPEVFTDGKSLSYFNERLFNNDLASFAGIAVLDFASENAFRDSIDEGTATELRLLHEVPQAVTLVSPFMEYVQETVFAGATSA